MSAPDVVQINVGMKSERWRHTDLHCPRCASPSLYYRAGETAIAVQGSLQGGLRYQCGMCGHETIMAPPTTDDFYGQRVATLKAHSHLARTNGSGALTLA